MKNQTDVIISITAIVLALIVGAVCYFTMPQAIAPAPPTAIVTTPAKMPEGAVRFANNLPGASNQAGGGGAPAGGAPAGGGRRSGALSIGVGGGGGASSR